MGMLWEAALAAGCALGLALAGWWLLGRLLRPFPGEEARALPPARGGGRSWNSGCGAFCGCGGWGCCAARC